MYLVTFHHCIQRLFQKEESVDDSYEAAVNERWEKKEEGGSFAQTTPTAQAAYHSFIHPAPLLSQDTSFSKILSSVQREWTADKCCIRFVF